MKNRTTTAVAVYLILVNYKGEIHMMRRCNTGYQDGMYQVWAGHVEMGELPIQAMIREAEEEAGIIVSKPDLRLVHVSCRPKHDETGNRTDFYFRAVRWTGEIINREEDKCDDMKWVSPAELPKNTTPHVRVAISNIFRGVFFSELSLEWIKSQPEYGAEYRVDPAGSAA